MTIMDTGIYGAKVQSWRHTNPRDLLKRLIEDNPKKDKTWLLKEFRDQALGEPDLIDTIIEYWFSNNYWSLVERPKSKEEVFKAEKIKEEIKEKIKTRIRQEAFFLLDTVLPNGKTLRNSTFGECSKFGGVLSAIAKKGKPNQKVGKVLSDAQLRKLQR